MSDLPGHDHDPNPAALDELRRAFAIGGADDTPADGLEATQAAPEAADGVDVTPTIASPDARPGSGRPDAVAPTQDAPDGDTGREPLITGREDAGAVGHGGADRPSAGHPRDERTGTEPDAIDQASETPPWLEQEFGGSAAADDHATPYDLVIVEQDPPAEPTPPRLIRIDGYGGSTEIQRPADVPIAAEPPPVASGDVPVASEPGGVITISDDELPDAVYVQGSLERDGSGSIVFIEDDITGDTLGPESERDVRRGIEPRMRERRVAVKRAQGRRRLRRVLAVAFVVLLVVGVLAVLGSPLFAVRGDDVKVFGSVYTDRDRLQEIIDDAVGTPVLRVDTAGIEESIEEIPWVEQATVRSDFPHGLVIDIRERSAVATYQGPDQRFRVLDRAGRVLDVLDLYPFAYVLIVGPDAVDLEPGAFAPQGYAAAAELAKNLTGTVRGRVTMIEVTADGSRLAMQLDDGSTVFFGEARDLLAKLVRLEAVMTNGEEREPGLIDVSTAGVTR